MNPAEASRKLPVDHDPEEAENNRAIALVEEFMRRPGLADPCLRYWISPVSEFSGDTVAATTACDGRFLYALLADAAGHGRAAATSMLPLLARFYNDADAGLPLGGIVRRANAELCAALPVGRFIAATFVRIDRQGSESELWLGGMPAALVIDPAGQILRDCAAGNLPLGIDDGDPHDVVAERLGDAYPPGAQLVLFSDGLIEAQNAAGEAFGMQRLCAAMAGAPVAGRLDVMKDAVNRHLGGQPAHDDISLLLIDLPAGRRD